MEGAANPPLMEGESRSRDGNSWITESFPIATGLAAVAASGRILFGACSLVVGLASLAALGWLAGLAAGAKGVAIYL